jgi:two-component system response regulator YesN
MEKFKEIKPQIVILDYHLNNRYPDAADGIQVLDWIKKENRETNVVILTNDDNLEIAKKSFKHGASDYVVKTETQFDKINYSLANLFKIIETKRDAKNYKIFFGLFLFLFALLAGVVITIQIFCPSILK